MKFYTISELIKRRDLVMEARIKFVDAMQGDEHFDEMSKMNDMLIDLIAHFSGDIFDAIREQDQMDKECGKHFQGGDI